MINVWLTRDRSQACPGQTLGKIYKSLVGNYFNILTKTSMRATVRTVNMCSYSMLTATPQRRMSPLGMNVSNTGNHLSTDACTCDHSHKTQRLTHAQGPQRDHTASILCDFFHLCLLTTVVSCGLIGPHQTTSHVACILSLLTRTLPCSHTPTPSYPLSFHTSCSSPPTPFSCLPFISFHLSSLLNSTTGIRVIL